MDSDTWRVLATAFGGASFTCVAIDWLLRTTIAGLTIWYLWQRIHHKSKKDEDDELE